LHQFQNTYVPHGAYWSTPFTKWQGSFANLHSLRFAAHVAKAELAKRNISPTVFDHAVLGTTVPQKSGFYGLPWFMSMVGNTEVGGTVVAQACATSARVLATAAGDLEGGLGTVSLCVAGDRTSNAPVVMYPNPAAQAGAPTIENWLLSNFAEDPISAVAMVGTAENCARDWQIGTEEQHEIVLRRWQQYEDATADGHAFQKRYMTLPFAVPDPQFRKTASTLEGDEGIKPSTKEGLARLKPTIEGGTVTFGGQTHPADGNAGMVLCTRERARELSRDAKVEIAIRSFGQSRTKPAYMPAAPVPAARQALERAGLDIKQIDAVKTHNPFVVNDIVFARETGFDVQKMNNYGCSLIYGHPNGPTGMRLIVELIEELVERGGGRGLFTGCAAGDTGMAAVVEVK
jgi:acetyl-CoA acetyltransferase family protein